MPVPEQLTNPNHLEEQSAAMQPALSKLALAGVGLSAEHFYGASDHFVGKVLGPENEHRLLVTRSHEGKNRNEAVGSGPNVEAALHDSLAQMRSLETVRTRSLAHIEMTPDSFVSFTSLEHYSPKVAPSRDTYPKPTYLEDLLASDTRERDTYDHTVAQEGWQGEVRTILDGYLADDPAGKQLAESLNIRSLSHLTPEQAVKLSAAFVQNVSKYSNADLTVRGATRADRSTAMDLLKEGMTRKGDPTWEGNGVCRNIASNVKAVFEALKATQGELSMLNNTYAAYSAGMEGAGYADKREDAYSMNFGRKSGHAWNTFTTIDAKGSAVSTIIDATWALGANTEASVEHLDRTEVRAAGKVVELFSASEVKTDAFNGLTDYTKRLIHRSHGNPQLSKSAREDVRGYITTEYLKAAAEVAELPEGYSLPDDIVSSASEISGKLTKSEVTTLLTLDKASGSFQENRLKVLLKNYDAKRKVPIPEWQSAENLIFEDAATQSLAYEAVGSARVQELAGLSGKFRARLREQEPAALPPFDAAKNPADAMELSHFAAQSGIHSKDPRTIMRQFNSTLKRLAASDAVFNAITAGRTDYDLAKNFTAISAALHAANKS